MPPKAAPGRRRPRTRMGRVLAERNEAVMPVGAWVENAGEEGQHLAFFSAFEVEEQLKEIHRTKMENLKRFQDNVKRRVSEQARMYKNHQQQRSCDAVERDNWIIRQSSTSADHLTPTKITCALHASNVEFAICSPSVKWVSAQRVGKVAEEAEKNKAFNDQAQKLSKVTKQARHRLASCQTIAQEEVSAGLPGGVWKVSPTRDNPVSRRKLQPSFEEDFTCLENQHDLPAELQEQQSMKDGKCVTFQLSEESGKVGNRLVCEPPPAGPYPGFSAEHRGAAILQPGVDKEESKKQRQCQYLMYRRLFMDLEREQVKAQRRQREHEKRIAVIKEEKERLRKAAENRLYQEIHQRCLMAESEKMLQAKLQEERKREQRGKVQKDKETTRYIEALRAQTMDKIKLQNTDLAPLCCCGSDFWDSHPDMCANNCIFYKNPKVYARALQSVLSSCDMWDGNHRSHFSKRIASAPVRSLQK
ncbi:coiled-coil domain-containing protein 15 [Callorhinchus milii]|uniref:Coiled-coil domain-containing protein 15 n=1 Tax=Callorhinchus milii TaxID=7868 RepID=A0A4W3H372_CALMI|nr:coiled-coil domain-containing protein 15 [Callorhinchus milii]|eukprot:gi/632956960/ref/XP_007894220.1/ PREDICTED: coiled-coil domain-containing protein 15 [Callorhinchus milii]